MGHLLLRPELNGPENMASYLHRGGYGALEAAVEGQDSQEVLAAVEAAGLKGRGGGNFLAARKWVEVSRGKGEKYVVVNGAEGEPGSVKDRFLLENHPHLVLEGALLAALAVGAEKIIFAINNRLGDAILAIEGTTQEALVAGYLGKVAVEVRRIPDAYVAGEETALLEVLEGKPPQPTLKPPFPVHFGLQGKPTLVHNVETLANVSVILRVGPGAYLTAGTLSCPGTYLYSLRGDVANPGVYELPGGSTLRDLIYGPGGGPTDGIKAVLPGGYSGGIVTSAELDLDETGLREAGTPLGCRSVTVLGESRDLWRTLEEVVVFFAAQSCGQCPPCFMGNSQLNNLIRSQGDLEGAAQMAGFLRGRGACGLLDGAASFVQAFVRRFPEEQKAKAG